MASGDERRKNLRVVFNAQVTVRETGGEGRIITSEETRDIILKGLYVYTSDPLPVATPCVVELRLAGEKSDLKLIIEGEVARNDSSGMGILFRQMEIDCLIHLKNILYYNSGEPERIDNELAGVY